MKKLVSLMMAMLVVMALLAGCGGASSSTAAPDSTAASSTGSDADSQGGSAPAAGGDVKIGVSFANMQEERWNREKVFFQNKADELGIEIVFQDANNEENKQLDQVQNLINTGIQCLIIVPVNAKTAATAVDAAKEADVPVVDYAKFIDSDKLDVYIGFSIFQLGVDLAKPAVEQVPKGNYAIISGSPNDANVEMCLEGIYSVLQPSIDSGDIKIVFDQNTENYSPEKAMAHAENALTQNNNDIDYFIVMNDGMAGGVVAALKAQGLDGKIPVTGLDGELAACQRIAEGTQTFSLYFPLQEQAETALAAAIELAEGKTPSAIDSVTTTEFGDIPTITLYTKTITQDTMMEIVIEPGIFTMEEVYKNVPEDQWPK